MLFLVTVLCICFSLVTSKTCICNFNHPRVQILQCPSETSPIVGFMDKSDANTLMFGAVNTDEPFCFPFLEHITTRDRWAAVLVNGKVGFVQRDYGERPVYCPGLLPSSAETLSQPDACAFTTVQSLTKSTTHIRQSVSTAKTSTMHPTNRIATTQPVVTTTSASTMKPTNSLPTTLPVVITTPILTSTTISHATMICICNFNHPRVQIHECPSDSSHVVGFMDKNDANSLMFGATVTDEPFCYPFLRHIHTQDRWGAILVNGQVGFVKQDVGEMQVVCPGTLPPNATALAKPKICTTTMLPPTTTLPPSTSIKSQPTTAAASSTVTKTNTSVETRGPRWPNCLATFIKCEMFNSLKHVTNHIQIRHPWSRHCMDGESESEGVIYQLCKNDTLMTGWKKGIRVKDLCHTDIPGTFVAVATFFHDRPIDAGIFVGCSSAGDLNVIQQHCGTNVELKLINGPVVEEYFTITF